MPIAKHTAYAVIFYLIISLHMIFAAQKG